MDWLSLIGLVCAAVLMGFVGAVVMIGIPMIIYNILKNKEPADGRSKVRPRKKPR